MPNIHPFIILFPIALLPLAFIFDLIAIATGNEKTARTAWLLQIVGTCTLLPTIASGLLAEGSGVVQVGAREAFETHEQLALISSTVFISIILWRVGCRGTIPSKSKLLYFALMAIGVCAIILTSVYGGELVYTHGTGVKAY